MGGMGGMEGATATTLYTVTALGTPVRLLPPPPATISVRCRAHSTPKTGYGSWCESVRASLPPPLLAPLLPPWPVLVIFLYLLRRQLQARQEKRRSGQ